MGANVSAAGNCVGSGVAPSSAALSRSMRPIRGPTEQALRLGTVFAMRALVGCVKASV